MTIDVSGNGDGSFTVTCGSESIIVGRPTPPGGSASGGGVSDGGGDDFAPVTDVSGGVCTFSILGRPHVSLSPDQVVVESQIVDGRGALRSALERSDLHRPTIVRIGLKSPVVPVRIHELQQMIARVHNPLVVRHEFYFTDGDDG